MPILPDYAQFAGRNWETGPISNYLAYRGFHNPATGESVTEALLMGVAGGAVFGYFTFAYEGYDPLCRLLTRNTFDPVQTMLSRLGIVQEVRQTTNPEKAAANLGDVLESGVPAVVLADRYSLPYNDLPSDDGMWMMAPVLVFGLDAGRVYLADRAGVPLVISADELQKARARIKKDKFRIATYGPLNPDKLAPAVQAGIWDCLKLYTEQPPKGSANNFGLQAFRFWIEQLTKPKARLSWARVFPPGPAMYAGLVGAYDSIQFFDGYGRAERELYADFLDEAAVLLDRPQLREPAGIFRRSAEAWGRLAERLLPDRVAQFGEKRRLMHERQELFVREGAEALDRIRAHRDREREIRRSMDSDFPLSEAESKDLLAEIAGQVREVHDVEAEAVAALQAAMG